MDLSSFSKETLIQMIYDLQKQVDKLKIDADIRITEIEKLLESQIDYINKKPEKIDTITQTGETIDDFDITKYENVWYMNGNAEDIINWDLRIKNGFVTTWNDNGKNNSILNKIKVGDLIVWYIVGRGYNSILEVKEKPHEITDEELGLLYDIKEKKEAMKKHNYKIISIPVNFLVTSSETFIINNKSLTTEISDSEWTFGLRGSHCIRPTSKKWNKQVEDIYYHLKNK